MKKWGGGKFVKSHIQSFNKISSPSVQELLHSLFYLLSYKKPKQSHKEMRKAKTAYIKITTIIQYITIRLDIFFTQHIYTLGQLFSEEFVEK